MSSNKNYGGKFIHPSKSNAFYLCADKKLNKTKRRKKSL